MSPMLPPNTWEPLDDLIADCFLFAVWKSQLDALWILYDWKMQRISARSSGCSVVSISTWVISQVGMTRVLREGLRIHGCNDTLIQNYAVTVDLEEQSAEKGLGGSNFKVRPWNETFTD